MMFVSTWLKYPQLCVSLQVILVLWSVSQQPTGLDLDSLQNWSLLVSAGMCVSVCMCVCVCVCVCVCMCTFVHVCAPLPSNQSLQTTVLILWVTMR